MAIILLDANLKPQIDFLAWPWLLPYPYGSAWWSLVMILTLTCRLTSQIDLRPASSPQHCFIICTFCWTGHHIRDCPPCFTYVLRDVPLLVGAFPYPPGGPSWFPASRGDTLLFLFLNVHSGSYATFFCVPWEPVPCREDKLPEDQLSLFSFPRGKSCHIHPVKHSCSRRKNMRMWHVNVLQCSLSVRFLGKYAGRGRRVFWYSKHEPNHPHRLDAARGIRDRASLEAYTYTWTHRILTWLLVSIPQAQRAEEDCTL